MASTKTKEELNRQRLDGMQEEIKREAVDGRIHHATLKSIANSWRWSYAVGCIYAKRLNIKVI